MSCTRGCRRANRCFVSWKRQSKSRQRRCWHSFHGWLENGKLRTSADPFVIALARVDNVPIVTDEKPTGNLQRPNIPDVCTALRMLPCMSLLQPIQAEKWVIG
jgi:hypothetical protein